MIVRKWIKGYWRNPQRKNNKPRIWVRGYYTNRILDLKTALTTRPTSPTTTKGK